jgi:undecaprenyl-diphosphatase
MTFDVAIQLGAIGAVVILYYKELFTISMIKKLLVGFIPTGIVGVLIYKHIKVLLQNPLIVVGSLFVGGIIILIANHTYTLIEKKKDLVTHIGYKEALLLGLYQTIAIIPGVSRSGAMIVGGMYMRLEKKILTEFTFLLAVPTMCAATLYSIYKHPESVTSLGNSAPLIVGFVTSFVVALIVISIFINYIRTRSFAIFGYYRIVLAVIALYLLTQ